MQAGHNQRRTPKVVVAGNRSRTSRKRACQTNMSHSRDSAETWVESGLRRVAETCSQRAEVDRRQMQEQQSPCERDCQLLHPTPLLSACHTSNTDSSAPCPPMGSRVTIDVSDLSLSLGQDRSPESIAERHIPGRPCSSDTWLGGLCWLVEFSGTEHPILSYLTDTRGWYAVDSHNGSQRLSEATEALLTPENELGRVGGGGGQKTATWAGEVQSTHVHVLCQVRAFHQLVRLEATETRRVDDRRICFTSTV